MTVLLSLRPLQLTLVQFIQPPVLLLETLHNHRLGVVHFGIVFLGRFLVWGQDGVHITRFHIFILLFQGGLLTL